MSFRVAQPDFLDAQPTKIAKNREKVEILTGLEIFSKFVKNHETGKDFDFFSIYGDFCGLGIEKIMGGDSEAHLSFANRQMIAFEEVSAHPRLIPDSLLLLKSTNDRF